MWEDEFFKILGWWCPPPLFAPPSQFLTHTITDPAPLRTTHLSPSLHQSTAVLHYCHACIRHILSGLIGPSPSSPLANQTPTPHTLRPAEGLKGRDPVLKSKPLIASHSLPCRQGASPAFTPHCLQILHPSLLHNTAQKSSSFVKDSEHLRKMKPSFSIRFHPSRLCTTLNPAASTSLPAVTRRSFSSTPSNLATWGFIGLGRMGELHASLSRVKGWIRCLGRYAPFQQ